MMKYIVGFSVFLWALGVMADDQKRPSTDDSTFLKVSTHNLQVSRTGNDNDWMKVAYGEKQDENMSDDDQVWSEDHPLSVYIPFMDSNENVSEGAVPTATPPKSFVGGIVENFSAPNKMDDNNYLPALNNNNGSYTFYGNFKNTFRVKQTRNDGTTFYLVVAGKLKGESKYRKLYLGTLVGKIEEQDYPVILDLNKVYQIVVDKWNSANIVKVDLIYFISSDSKYRQDWYDLSEEDVTNIKNSNYGGAYYTLEFSKKTYDDSGLTVNDAWEGDQMATMEYSGGPSMSIDNRAYQYALVAFQYTATPTFGSFAPGQYLKDLTGKGKNIYALYYKENNATDEEKFDEESGKFIVKKLTNGQTYYLGLYVVNKFQYATPVAFWDKALTPEEIQAFIQKQTCYLLSAGFGRSHFVIDFFKAWRDNFLQKFGLGRAFIRWYYATAPQYTPLIYNHRHVQIVVQGLGYTAYALVRFWYWWVAALLSGILGWGWYRHRKTI